MHEPVVAQAVRPPVGRRGISGPIDGEDEVVRQRIQVFGREGFGRQQRDAFSVHLGRERERLCLRIDAPAARAVGEDRPRLRAPSRSFSLVPHQLLADLEELELARLRVEAVVVPAVSVEELVGAEVLDAELGVDPHPVVVVLDPERGRIRPEAPSDPAAVEEARADEVVLQQIERLGAARDADRGGVRRAPILRSEVRTPQGLPIGSDHDVVGVDHRGCRMVAQKLDQALEMGPFHDVVGRRPRVEFTAGEPERVRQRRGELAILLGQDPDPGVVHEGGEHRLDAVGGAIVEDDQFELGVGLREDALDALGEEFALVVDREDDADFACCLDRVPVHRKPVSGQLRQAIVTPRQRRLPRRWQRFEQASAHRAKQRQRTLEHLAERELPDPSESTDPVPDPPSTCALRRSGTR